MSNFIETGVVGATLKGQAWSGLIERSKEILLDVGYTPKSVGRMLNGVIANEAHDAHSNALSRPRNGMSDAEFDYATEKLVERLVKVRDNMVKNYVPVLVRTYKEGLPFFDGDGNPIPKTAMETAYKAKAIADAEDATPVSPMDVARKKWASLQAYCRQHSIDIDDITNGEER